MAVPSELFETFPDPLVICAPDGTCATANAAARSLLGAEEGASLSALGLAAIGAGESGGEVRLADGRVFDWRRAREDGRPVISLRDVTEQRRALEEARRAREQAEAASRAKDEFLATVSHELRTPLTAILGWAHLLRSGRLDETASSRAIDTIQRNATLQTQLISDILDVSRIVTGKLRLTVRPLDVADVVEAALDTVRPMAEQREVRLAADLPPGLGQVAGDPDRLQQVVWNLLTNALKFTPAGGTVSVRGVKRGGTVEIEVKDTGSGISPEFLPHVFERFRQEGPRGMRGGLGLGLAIVRHLVELHGGSVAAASAGTGQGATFTVVLPSMEKVMAAAAVPPVPPGGEPWDGLAGVSVLVVEDEDDARELLRTLLAGRGATVVAVSSAAEALDAFDRQRPDVLLSDIEMAGEDGYSLLRRLRARAPADGGRVPAAAITAYARSEDRLQALLAGFQMHVPKPVNPEELVTVVASLAGRLRDPR